MEIDFLRRYGARRIRNYEPQPFLLDDGSMMEDEPQENVKLDFEQDAEEWRPFDVSGVDIDSDWTWRPRRFVDGKDVGRTVAWLQSREGFPVPVRLSEIGAVVMRDVNGQLRREFQVVERVVSLMVDLFPWDEVEHFAAELRENDFRLLPVSRPESGWSYDFERMRKTTQNRSNDEMARLERQMLARACEAPVIVDGRLDPRASAFNIARDHVVGLIKTHSKNYLHAQGWRIFYNLQPGQRTPTFRIKCDNLAIVSWYLRLDGARGELPSYGVVRVEIAERLFEDELGRDFAYVNRISRLLCDCRCRDESYSRAAVSIHPIQRAEESLGALFTSSDALIGRFYRLTGL
jgi:hypothetical protein